MLPEFPAIQLLPSQSDIHILYFSDQGLLIINIINALILGFIPTHMDEVGALW